MENQSQLELGILLQSFSSDMIFYTPSYHVLLKSIFKNCSKKENDNPGYPDRILFSSVHRLLVVIECKYDSIQKCKRDLELYKRKMNYCDIGSYHIYFVGFVSSNCYTIYNSSMDMLDVPLSPTGFNLNRVGLLTITEMEKQIHKIHNYIRDYTKISNEDKGIFIALILICISKPRFKEQLIECHSKSKYIYDLMECELSLYELDISVFVPFRNDSNNKHLKIIAEMVLSVYETDPSVDLLNRFYSEFVKYNNKDGKHLGIVLTPDYIADLLIDVLQLSDSDIFLDSCSGSGSFPLKALSRGCKKVIACEYQNKLFTLMKCNFILRNISSSKYTLIKNDSFMESFSCTKSAINPPYAMKDNSELDFILKQLESTTTNGLTSCILPSSCIGSSRFLYLKKQLLEIGTPEVIINVSKDVFYPFAAVHCNIMVIRKKKYNNTPVLFINYENDEFRIEKHRGRVMSSKEKMIRKYDHLLSLITTREETDISVLSTITHHDDWNFHSFNTRICFDLSSNDIDDKQLSLQYTERRIQRQDIRLIMKQPTLYYAIHDIFIISTVKRTTKTTAENNPGNVPYISASALNNGITAMTNIITHRAPLFTLANSGSVGVCFFHTYDTCLTDSVFALHLKPCYTHLYTNTKLMMYLACLLEKNKVKYSFGRACRLNKIYKDTILLPSDRRGFPIINKLNEN